MRKDFGVKSWFYPLPVLIIGTYDANGKADAMNAAWGGLYDSNLVELCLSEGHKTYKNIIEKKAFTISFATANTVKASDYVGIVSARNEENKMEKAGFTTTKSEFVNAPIINELPLTIECELKEVIQGSKFLGEIKNVNVDESVLGEDGEIDLNKFTPITYDPVHHYYVELGDVVGKAFNDGKKLK